MGMIHTVAGYSSEALSSSMARTWATLGCSFGLFLLERQKRDLNLAKFSNPWEATTEDMGAAARVAGPASGMKGGALLVMLMLSHAAHSSSQQSRIEMWWCILVNARRCTRISGSAQKSASTQNVGVDSFADMRTDFMTAQRRSSIRRRHSHAPPCPCALPCSPMPLPMLPCPATPALPCRPFPPLWHPCCSETVREYSFRVTLVFFRGDSSPQMAARSLHSGILVMSESDWAGNILHG